MHDLPGQPRTGWDLLFPPRCLSCQRRGGWICATCWPALYAEIDPQTVCAACLTPYHSTNNRCVTCAHTTASGLRSITTLGVYDGLLKRGIHDLKYRQRHGVAHLFADLLAPVIISLADSGASTLAAVPLHPQRQRQRGYNQSQVLCHHLARRATFALATDLVRRRANTRDQIGLNRQQRALNMQEAFICAPSGPGQAIQTLWLVDDVTTSGATLHACAMACQPWLATGQVAQLRGLAIARAVLA